MSEFQFGDVLEFAQAASKVTTTASLRAIVRAATEAMGFDYFALLNHVDLSSPPRNTIRIENYPDAWTRTFVEKKFFAVDPVHAACETTTAGFLWKDLPSLVHLTAQQRAILSQAARSGLGEGYTVPVHMPGEFPGSISFAVRHGRSFPRNALPAAHMVGCYAYEAARRLTRCEHARKARANAKPPNLTPRERQCVILSAKGDSDKAIARNLGLSEVTAHKHIENAKRAYGVRTRPQLAVHALFYGHATFSDVLEESPRPHLNG